MSLVTVGNASIIAGKPMSDRTLLAIIEQYNIIKNRNNEIRRLRATGISYKKIAILFGITRQRVQQIVSQPDAIAWWNNDLATRNP